MAEAKPFKGTCRGATCGQEIWMMPITKRDGRAGWAPMDVDEEDPDTPPEEYDQSRSHFLTCPDAEHFSRKGEGDATV